MNAQGQQAQDLQILQKVNAAHRAAFRDRFPGQLEHCLRLTAERLQACLVKPDGMRLPDPKSWPATAQDIQSLSRALSELWQVYREVRSHES
jgi:hypothetical protein